MRKRLIEERKKLRFTGTLLAKELGISPATMFNIEQKNRNPSLRAAISIHKVLKEAGMKKIGIEELFEEFPNDEENETPEAKEKCV